jgi:hypothetical protein
LHNAAKEGLHGFIEASEHVLLELAMNIPIFLTQPLDGR